MKFTLKLVGLSFLTLISGLIGSGNNAVAAVMAPVFFICVPALYLLPTIEAWTRKHRNLASIALVNVLLGWSLVGWVIAAAWALKKPELTIVEPAAAPVSNNTKSCPYCAETIQAAAIRCKHCHADLSA